MPCTISCAEPLFLELALAGVLPVAVGAEEVWGVGCLDFGGIVKVRKERVCNGVEFDVERGTGRVVVRWNWCGSSVGYLESLRPDCQFEIVVCALGGQGGGCSALRRL